MGSVSSEIWLTVAECADLLNVTRSAIKNSVQRNRYVYRYAKNRSRGGRSGKNLLIALSSLPEMAQVAYWDAQLKPPSPICNTIPLREVPEPPEPTFAEAPEWKRQEAMQWVDILQEWERIESHLERGQITVARQRFCDKYGFTIQTLYRKLRAWRNAPAGKTVDVLLSRQDKNRGRTLALTEVMKARLATDYLDRTQPPVRHVYEDLVVFCEETGQQPPSESSVRRYLQGIPPTVLTYHRQGGDAYRTQFGYYTQRDLNYLPVGAWAVADHRQFDLLVYEDDRRKRVLRPWLTAIMDLRSRKFVGVHIDIQPNSTTIGLAILNMLSMEDDGDVVRGYLPDNFYMDDGKDFRSAYLNGETFTFKNIGRVELSDDTRGVIQQLGITPVHTVPYSPQSKPIEPAFRNIPLRFERKLPGWTGNKPENKPEKLAGEIRRGDLLTMDELRDTFPDFLDEYDHKEHRGIQATPDEVFYAGFQPFEIDKRALWLLLMKTTRPIKVQRNGVKPLGQGIVFWHDDLGVYVDRKVHCRWDPADIRYCHVFDLDNQYICTAENIPLSRMGETSEAEFKAAASRKKGARKRVANWKEDVQVAGDIHEALRAEKRARRRPDPEPEPLRAAVGAEPVRYVGPGDQMAQSMQKGGRTTRERRLDMERPLSDDEIRQLFRQAEEQKMKEESDA